MKSSLWMVKKYSKVKVMQLSGPLWVAQLACLPATTLRLPLHDEPPALLSPSHSPIAKPRPAHKPKRQIHSQMSSSANFVAPGQQRYLRACMVCSVVMTYSVSSLAQSPTTQPSTIQRARIYNIQNMLR